jgi:integrase
MGPRLKLPPYVHAFVDRHGKARFYFRRLGFKRVPLPGLPYTSAFMEAYQLAKEGQPAQIGSSRARPGTISALVVAYYNNSAEFKHEWAPETRRKRRNIVEQFRDQHGDKPLALLQREHIHKMLAKIDQPHAKKNWLKAVRSLMRFAVSIGMRADDPTEGIKLATTKSDGFQTWSEDHIAIYRRHHPIGTRARLALELLLGTAQRRGDVIRMGRQHIRNGILSVRQNKTGVELKVPVHPDLRVVLDATPSEHLTFLTTTAGKPFTSDGFGHWFREMCDEAGLHGLTAHGLRKAACRRLAEAGCSEKQIAAISGHVSLNEIVRYTRAADQERLAHDAMTKMATSSGKPWGGV